MWYAIFNALAALLSPILRDLVSRGTDAVKAVDAPFNTDARKRWVTRVREFKSRTGS